MQKLLFSTILVSTLFCLPGCKSEIDLKFNLAKGTKFEYAMTTDINMKQNMMGQEMEVKNSMGFTYLFETVSDSGEWKKLSSIITKINMDIDAMGNSMHFDTDTPVTDTVGPMVMFEKVFGAMKGSQFFFTISKKGEIKEVSGFKELQDKMIAAIPDDDGGMEGMKNSFNEESVKQNLQQGFQVYPDKPVKVGESWNKKMNVKTQGMDFVSDNTYKLESVSGNDAIIKLASKLNSAAPSPLPGGEMTMTGTADGVMHFDLPTGMTTDGNIKMVIDMKIKSGGNEMPMKIDMLIKIKGRKM